MFRLNNYLKTNKIMIFFIAIGIISYEMVRWIDYLFYFFILFIIILSIYINGINFKKIDKIIVIPVAIYFTMIFLGILFSKNYINVIQGFKGLVNSFILMLIFYIFFAVTDRKVHFIFENIIFVVFIISLMVAFFEFGFYIFYRHSYIERTISLFFNPNTFAFFLIISLPLIFLRIKNETYKLYLSSIVLPFILMSGSRTGLSIYLFEILLLNFKYIKKYLKQFSLTVILAILIFLPKIIYRIPKIENFYNNNNAVFQRFYAYIVGLKIVKEYNIEGIGPGQFVYFFDIYKDISYSLHSAHNLFLNIMCEYGLIGFIFFFFLTILGITISSFLYFQKKNDYNYNLFVGYLLMTVFQLFDMAEITNIRMIPLNIIYIYYIYLIFSKFSYWRDKTICNKVV